MLGLLVRLLANEVVPPHNGLGPFRLLTRGAARKGAQRRLLFTGSLASCQDAANVAKVTQRTTRHTGCATGLQIRERNTYRKALGSLSTAKRLLCLRYTHPLRGPGRGRQQAQLRHLVGFPQLPGSFLHVQGRCLRVVESLAHVLALPVPLRVLRQLRPPGVCGALVGPHLCKGILC